MVPRTLYAVAAKLPFHLDDIARVNDTFVRLQRHPNADDRDAVELWTYCYIYRYFLIKCATARRTSPLPLDELVTRAFSDMQRHRNSVRQPDRYAHWVSKLCRNTYINHLRGRRSYVELREEGTGLRVVDVKIEAGHDESLLHEMVRDAVERLPDYLRDVARMRFLEDRPYSEIQEVTGKPLDVLRSYANKSLNHLRRHTALQTLAAELYT